MQQLPSDVPRAGAHQARIAETAARRTRVDAIRSEVSALARLTTRARTFSLWPGAGGFSSRSTSGRRMKTLEATPLPSTAPQKREPSMSVAQPHSPPPDNHGEQPTNHHRQPLQPVLLVAGLGGRLPARHLVPDTWRGQKMVVVPDGTRAVENARVVRAGPKQEILEVAGRLTSCPAQR